MVDIDNSKNAFMLHCHVEPVDLSQPDRARFRMEGRPDLLNPHGVIHGGALYITYLGTYLLNGWLARGITPLLVFSAIFVLGYLAVWAVIYSVTKRNTEKLNRMLQQQQQTAQP
jgi:hypothetical protein